MQRGRSWIRRRGTVSAWLNVQKTSRRTSGGNDGEYASGPEYSEEEIEGGETKSKFVKAADGSRSSIKGHSRESTYQMVEELLASRSNIVRDERVPARTEEVLFPEQMQCCSCQ